MGATTVRGAAEKMVEGEGAGVLVRTGAGVEVGIAGFERFQIPPIVAGAAGAGACIVGRISGCTGMGAGAEWIWKVGPPFKYSLIPRSIPISSSSFFGAGRGVIEIGVITRGVGGGVVGRGRGAGVGRGVGGATGAGARGTRGGGITMGFEETGVDTGFEIGEFIDWPV